MKGQKWKNMRSMLSPVFTSSKLRMMFNVLSDNAIDFTSYFKDEFEKNDRVFVETKDKFSRFTINGIARSVFSMDADFLRRDTDNLCYDLRRAMRIDIFTHPKIFILNFFPKLYEKLGMRLFNKRVVDFTKSISIDAIKYREDNNIVVKDVLQLLMDAKKGQLKQEEGAPEEEGYFSAHREYFAKNKNIKNHVWTDDEIISQGFVFFFAGFETTTNLLQMCAYELAKNPDIQDQLIEEIDAVRESLNGEPVTYEIINQMKLIEMVILETMRIWPPSPHAGNRKCTKEYTFETDDGKSVKINPGDNIYYPVLALHYDEKYWPNPKQFDPYRFSDENKLNIHPATYLPFGIGPRSCIWSRFGLIEAKLLLYHFLTDFKFQMCEKTPKKIEFECYFTVQLKTPMCVEVVRR
jgi:cytochrome P450 family 9